jgi:hypothetical protein
MNLIYNGKVLAYCATPSMREILTTLSKDNFEGRIESMEIGFDYNAAIVSTIDILKSYAKYEVTIKLVIEDTIPR